MPMFLIEEKEKEKERANNKKYKNDVRHSTLEFR